MSQEPHSTEAAKPSAPAAQYVRMSTDHQKYSIENQMETIGAYAARRDLTIVRTYRDDGKSGLDIGHRPGLRTLIADVRGGRTDFGCILVYDVSRWGRFQDADESAYYEFICKEAGIKVHYCAEQFENDGSLPSAIMKAVKRVMAGEYSRELSTKVFIGQSHLAKLGFWQGGSPPIGMRRLLVDEKRIRKFVLEAGQQKSLQTDRVILTPGPDEEVEIVRRIFKSFVVEGKSRSAIARELNVDGILTARGYPWRLHGVHEVLISEKYIGHNVFNRTSIKLGKGHLANPPDMWIRCENAFEPVVDATLFNSAQAIIARRRDGYSDAYMLEGLRALWRQKGDLTRAVISASPHLPHPVTYSQRFGSLVNAYALIGFEPKRDFRLFHANVPLLAAFEARTRDIISNIERRGGTAKLYRGKRTLTINDAFTVAIGIAWYRQAEDGAARWKVYFRKKPATDLCLVIRMDEENKAVRDYYVLPTADVRQAKGPNLYIDHPIFAATYRYDDLEPFYSLCAREEVKEAA